MTLLQLESFHTHSAVRLQHCASVKLQYVTKDISSHREAMKAIYIAMGNFSQQTNVLYITRVSTA